MARAIGAMALSACARFPRSCLGVMTATAGLAGVGGHHPPEPGRSGRQGNTSHCGIPFGKPTRVCGNRDWQHGSPRDYGAEQRPLKAEISKVASKSAASPQCGAHDDAEPILWRRQHDQKRHNMLVMRGEDIGISNLSCYSDGLMATAASRTRRSSSYSTTPSQRTPRESIWRSTSRSGSEKELNVVMFPPRQSCVVCPV